MDSLDIGSGLVWLVLLAGFGFWKIKQHRRNAREIKARLQRYAGR